MKKFVIGIDSGTQSTRVIMFDLKGNIVCSGKAMHPPVISEQSGYAVHDYEDLFNGLCEASKQMFSCFQGNLKDICAIGLSGQRGTVYFIGKNNEQLCQPISWMDLRWKENLKYTKLCKNLDPWREYLVSYSKMNWMKRNRPEIADKVYKYLTAPAFLGYKLFGGYVDTYANNLGMPINRQKWSLYEEDEIFMEMGLRRDQLANYIMPGEIMGHISQDAADKTGFPEGCPVVACAGDKQCEVLGAGSIEDGQAYITLGTLCGLDIVGETYIEDEYKKLKHRTYLAAVPGTWHAEAAISKGFWLISWFRDNFAEGLKSEGEAMGVSIEALLDIEAEKIAAGSEGLVTIPDWKANWDKPAAKGMMIGFDHRHKRSHMFRSLIEGIIMQLKINTDEMCESANKTIIDLRVGGGGSKSNTAVQVISDVFGIKVKRSKVSETCSLGCAICAAVGAGAFPSFNEAVAAMGQSMEEFYPNYKNHNVYNQLIEKIFKQCYVTNEKLLVNIGRITS